MSSESKFCRDTLDNITSMEERRKIMREKFPKEEAELDVAIRSVREQVKRGGMPQDLIDKFFPEPKR